jgi:hypothetical protein
MERLATHLFAGPLYLPTEPIGDKKRGARKPNVFAQKKWDNNPTLMRGSRQHLVWVDEAHVSER